MSECGVIGFVILGCLVVPGFSVHQVRFQSSLPARLVFLASDAASGLEEAGSLFSASSTRRIAVKAPEGITLSAKVKHKVFNNYYLYLLLFRLAEYLSFGACPDVSR